jgi:ADP-heptose:LPS heptosyltransferase
MSPKEAVLFAQHSAAGDILMTTQCLKGIKEKHPNLPLVYMTQNKFANIVEENPYIDEIIPWDPINLNRKYKVVYNPHGERILPGRFNTLDVKLHAMYPYFCKVETDVMHITPETPEKFVEVLKAQPFVLIHTTGAADSRIYRHMDMVVSGLEYNVVQVGGASDLRCIKADIDLRGQLTWRENVYVMDLAKAAVAVDSFFAHLAGARNVPAVVLFGPAPARVTGPRSDFAKVICLEPNHLDVCPEMGFCYGQAGACGSSCINTISPVKVKEALQSLLKEDE